MKHFSEILKKIPKSELHVHLRGAMPVEIFTEFLYEHPIKEILPLMPAQHLSFFEKYSNIRHFLTSRSWNQEDVKKMFVFRSFEEFLATFFFTSYFIRNIFDFRKLVYGVLNSLKAQNIVYAEITLSIGEYRKNGISAGEIKECLEETACFPGLEVQWIIDLVRNNGTAIVMDILKEIIAIRCKTITGITLGGAEHLYPPVPFKDAYDLARDNGLNLTIHAGESLGPQSIWDALLVLKAQRIGHGVQAIQDKNLLKYLSENQIPLEICPTSNFKTSVIPQEKVHPVKEIFEAGIPVTLNTDDPTFFGTNLLQEYEYIHQIGMSQESIFQIIENGFRYAFLDEQKKKRYLESLEQYRKEIGTS